MLLSLVTLFFFFQAEDGIRDGHVTGVQTCALPIYFKIDTTGFKPVQVLDLCTPDFRIGHGDSDIVEGVHLSGEEANLIDDSHRTVYTDRISYPERAKRENHNTGCNIAQSPLKSEAYCQSRSTQYCDDTCGFHSELSQHSQQCDDQNKNAGNL